MRALSYVLLGVLLVCAIAKQSSASSIIINNNTYSELKACITDFNKELNIDPKAGGTFDVRSNVSNWSDETFVDDWRVKAVQAALVKYDQCQCDKVATLLKNGNPNFSPTTNVIKIKCFQGNFHFTCSWDSVQYRTQCQ